MSKSSVINTFVLGMRTEYSKSFGDRSHTCHMCHGAMPKGCSFVTTRRGMMCGLQRLSNFLTGKNNDGKTYSIEEYLQCLDDPKSDWGLRDILSKAEYFFPLMVIFLPLI